MKVNLVGIVLAGFGCFLGVMWQLAQPAIWFSGCMCDYWVGGGCIDVFGHLLLLTPYVISFALVVGGLRSAFQKESSP